MKKIFTTILLLAVSLASFSHNIRVAAREKGKTNKTLHLYNGNIEIVKDGFVVTFFYSGRYQLTITTDEGEVLYYGEVTATANQPMFISSVGVSPDEDEVENDTF
ncbi:MAG: hypothetical protein IKR17_01525 [Bacteroidales bacterium]|nr:hypothetical protein [Bacteroidales bacterium]